MRSVAVASNETGVPGLPWEKCGLLLGRESRIVRADETANVCDTPHEAFEIDPAALLLAHRTARKPNALQILGYYHTHPVGDATPSIRDAQSAQPDGMLWLIASRTEARLWRAVAEGKLHGRFDPVQFDLKVGNRGAERVGGVKLR